MTSSKKAKKPSIPFKKATWATANPGDKSVRERAEQAYTNSTVKVDPDKGRKPVKTFRTGDKADFDTVVGGKKDDFEQKANDAIYQPNDESMVQTTELTPTRSTPGAEGQNNPAVQVPKTTFVGGATPRERGGGINPEMKNDGESDQEAASRLEGNNKTGAERVSGRLTEESRDRIHDSKSDEDVRTPEKARKESDKVSEERNAERQAAADAEKKKKDEAEIQKRIAAGKKKAFEDGVAFGPEDEQKIRSEYAQEQAQAQIDEMNENERQRIRQAKFDELVAEKQKNGEEFNSSELMAEADRYASEEMGRVEEDANQNHEVSHDPQAAKARAEVLQKSLDWLGGAVNAVGAIGEYANKGLDIMRGVLNGMLYPSPLGLNEAQTMISTTAEAFNLATELVENMTKKGEEMMGKKVVKQMAETMGSVINAHFNGKDPSRMTPQELDEYTDRLTQAWAPFVSRLEMIGAGNPVGRAIADKFLNTFGQIKTQAKGNKENLRLQKKKHEQQIRDMKREVEELKFNTKEDVINYTRNYHNDLYNPQSGRYDQQAALGLELLNEHAGHDSSGLPYELTHDANGNSIVDDNYYAVLLDKKYYMYDPYSRKFKMTPQAAQIVAKRIAGMRASEDQAYMSDPKKYDDLFKDLTSYTVRTNELINDARSEQKFDQHMEGAATPIQRVIAAKTLSDRNYIRKQIALGHTLAEIFPEKDRESIRTAAGADVRKYEAILSQRPLTQAERNAYNIAKNTQDLVAFIDDVEKFKAQVKILRDKEGDAEWINPKTGQPKFNPQTNQNFKNSEIYNYDVIDKALNDIDRLMEEQILSVPLDYSHMNANGDVQRTHIMQVSNGQSDSVRQRLLDIQSLFPGVDAIKDPASYYRDRIGMGDITAAVYQAMNTNEDNMTYFAFVVDQGLKTIDSDIKAFDAKSESRDTQLIGILSGISGEVSGLSKMLANNPGADTQKIVDAIDGAKDTISNGLAELAKRVGGENEDLGKKLDALKSVGEEALKALKDGDPNAKQLAQKFVQMSDAIVVKLDDETISRLGTGGGPQPPPAGEKRAMPSWYDNNMNAGAAEQWYSNMINTRGISDPHNPASWPADQYWDIQNDLLALIENTDNERDRAILRNTAQTAFRNGMFGQIGKQVVNGEERYYVANPEGSVKPLVNLVIKNGKIDPPFHYINSKGETVELTADNYNEILGRMYAMNQNATASRLDSQNNLDLSKDATSRAGGEKYMRALIKLFGL